MKDEEVGIEGASQEVVSQRNTGRNTTLFVAFMVLILLGFVTYQKRAAFSSALHVLKLLPQQETFTELYIPHFTAVTRQLPSHIARGQELHFSFEVHNHEGHDMRYPYIVYVVDQATGTTTFDLDTLHIPNNGTQSILETYRFHAESEGATVYVALPELHQSIHFFIPTNV